MYWLLETTLLHSRTCQKAEWKNHKPGCIKSNLKLSKIFGGRGEMLVPNPITNVRRKADGKRSASSIS